MIEKNRKCALVEKDWFVKDESIFFLKTKNLLQNDKNKEMLKLVDKVQGQIGGMQPKFTV